MDMISECLTLVSYSFIRVYVLMIST